MKQNEQIVRESFSRQSFMSTLGATITAFQDGMVEVTLPFTPTLTQQNGFVHAGAITSIMDSACGYAAKSVSPADYDVLSVEFKVNLLTPAAGERFIARATVKRAGKTLTVCTADAFAVQGREQKLVATMLATMINVPPGKR